MGDKAYKKIDEQYLKGKLEGLADVFYVEETSSTNAYSKALPISTLPKLVISDSQSNGRGRFGRSFYSPAGLGLYMSIVFEPDCYFEKGQLATVIAAVAVSRAIAKICGLKTKIKWVNDIYFNDKKVAGILTEAETNFETGRISKIIVGIGVNCYKMDFPYELDNTAISLDETGEAFRREDLAAEIFREFCTMFGSDDKLAYIDEYRAKSTLIGEDILVYNSAISEKMGRTGKTVQGIRAKAIGIDDEGGLIVEFMEGSYARQIATLKSGEVTIRKRY